LGVGAGYLLEGMVAIDIDARTRGSAKTGKRTYSTARNDFTISFLVLIAGVIKADGKIHQSEMDFVKGHLISLFGLTGAQESMRVLQGIIQQPIPIEAVSRQIAHNMDYSSRLELLHLLFGVAAADEEIHQSESTLLSKIAQYLGLTSKDFKSIEAMFISLQSGPYDILEISPQATGNEIKKAYRLMAQKYHPDKVSHLGDEYKEQANKKFQQVNDAYEKIRDLRGL
ncbi:MAG: molecular chaperone DjiA, partial [Spirochaetaceae bacterium]|nr:molecular chaperone DjiA [Spirochaetaceae bacterium]